MALADTARLAVQLDLKGNFGSALKANQKALGSFDAAVTRSSSRAFKAGQQVGIGFKNAGRLIAAGAVTATGALVGVLKVAGDFESQLNTINTIARANAKDLGLIGEGIRKVARDTGASLEDLTTGYYDLLSAGIAAKDAQNVLTQANTLAIGGLSSTAEAVDLLTTAINTYGGDATKAAAYTDVFAKAIERGKVTAADLAANFSSVGPLAASLGVSIEELGAGFATLTAAGTSAGEASTQMASALSALLKKTPDLEKLEKATGRNYAALAGSKGLNVALQQMQKDAKGAGIELVDLVGRKEALLYILQTTGPNMEKYTANLTAMGDAAGTAAEQMAERQKGLNFQLSILKAKVQDAAIVIGSAILPKITPVFERLNKALSDPKVVSQIQAFGESLAGLFSDSNIEEGAKFLQGALKTAQVAAPIVAEAAKTTFGFVQAAVGLFTSLPKEIQGLAIGAFAINKITGGLVTNIAGGLISSVLKQLVSGVVNVNGAVVNVNGAAGLPGVGGGGGGIVGALKTGLKIVLPVAIAAGIYEALSSNRSLRATDDNPFGLFDSKPSDTLGTRSLGGPKVSGRFTAPAGGGSSDRTKDDLVNLQQLAKGTNALLADGFKQMVAQLKGAKSPAAIQAAVAATLKTVVGEGRGDVGSTKDVLAELRKQLKNTHDPKTAAALRSAIAKVERKVQGREWAQKQIAKADAILKSSASTKDKIEDLKAIERSLLTRGLPKAASQINSRIDAAKRAQVAAARASTEAIKDKDLSVKIGPTYISIDQKFSIANSIKTQQTYKQIGGKVTAS